MSVTVVSIKCPECGASQPVEESRNICFCSYCGAKILIVNENEHVYRRYDEYHHIDEAGIRRAEADKEIRLKEIERAEKNDKTKRIIALSWLGFCLILIIATVVLYIVDFDIGIVLLVYVCLPVLIGGSIVVTKIVKKIGGNEEKPKEKRRKR